MPSVKAPRWLTQGFARGVDERQPARPPKPAYPGANPYCVLAASDARRRPCDGRLERFHWINRQRAANALSALLPNRYDLIEQLEARMGERGFWLDDDAQQVASWHGEIIGSGKLSPLDDLIPLIEWDPRNADFGCEGHHRRFDSHLTPALTVRYEHLPSHLIHFAFDWGIDGQLDRFPSEI